MALVKPLTKISKNRKDEFLVYGYIRETNIKLHATIMVVLLQYFVSPTNWNYISIMRWIQSIPTLTNKHKTLLIIWISNIKINGFDLFRNAQPNLLNNIGCPLESRNVLLISIQQLIKEYNLNRILFKSKEVELQRYDSYAYQELVTNNSKSIPLTEAISEAKRVEYQTFLDQTTFPKVQWQGLTVPNNIKQLPKIKQAEKVAMFYKKLLFNKIPRRKHLGGWLLLSLKNYKRCKNNKILSPVQLGFDIIQPKSLNDKEYKKTLLYNVINENIKIKNCYGTTGSFKVVIELQNTTNKDQTVTIPAGQVFEQNRFRKVQNLAVVNLYNKDHNDCRLKADESVEITLESYETKTVELNCDCIDHHHSSPSNDEIGMTPFKSKASINATNQNDTWEQLDSEETNDLYSSDD